MNRTISILVAVLMLQVLISIAAHMGGDELAAFTPQENLFTFSEEAVDKIRIEADAETVVEIDRGEDGIWALPALDNFPADSNKVKTLLKKMISFKKGWPVATTAGAAKRFKVAAEGFERKVTLQAKGKTVAEFYIGSSPGLRKVHARAGDDDNIYSIHFTAYDAGTDNDSWIKNDFLKLDKKKITKVIHGDVKLERTADTLTLVGITGDQQLDTDKADTFLDRVAKLTIQSVLGTEAKPEYQQDKPVFNYSITLNDGGTIDYRFSRPEGEDYYVLKTSQHDFYFKIPEWRVKPIKDTTLDKLIRDQDQGDSKNAADNSADEGLTTADQHPE